ncbi:MAG: isopentenyl-diphosphate Delta-isomerase [Flavobacteriales bacterium]|nr:isopentenyl-diphosphate Delta-isomerase [Flavobacteriales bacterium]
MEEYVVLVNNQDQEIGQMKKLEAHQTGLLHRAFSVFVFNSKGEILLQKRNSKKYHSGGLWSNTCCSHPRPGEPVHRAAKRRLMEEMGMKTKLFNAFSFIYKSHLDNDLIEHELDHVYYGYSNNFPQFNTDEVEAVKYISPEALQLEMLHSPEMYTEWLKICLDHLLSHLNINESHEQKSKKSN